jgi:hypothetical protein
MTPEQKKRRERYETLKERHPNYAKEHANERIQQRREAVKRVTDKFKEEHGICYSTYRKKMLKSIDSDSARAQVKKDAKIRKECAKRWNEKFKEEHGMCYTTYRRKMLLKGVWKNMIPAEKRKFSFHGNKEKKMIAEMNLDELRTAEKYCNMRSNAAGWNDEGTLQNYWIGAQNLCNKRIDELEKKG